MNHLRWKLLVLATGILVLAIGITLFSLRNERERPAEVVPPDAATTSKVEPAPPPREVTLPDVIAGETKLYFAVSKGTSWLYEEDGQEWTEIVTGSVTKGRQVIIDVDQVVGNGNATPLQRVAVSPKGLVLLERAGVKEEPPFTLLEPPPAPIPDIPELQGLDRLPLIGPRWTAGKETYSASGPEPVEVPAGKFLAVRVESGETTEPRHRSNLFLPLTETRWYAPDVGLVKRTMTSPGGRNTLSERVLKKFCPGKEDKALPPGGS